MGLMPMDSKTADILREMNNAFYRDNAAAFAATRQKAWPGWNRCLQTIEGLCADPGARLVALDLACGNQRFAKFLEAALPQARLSLYAVDNCAELVPELANMQFQHLDILEVLQDG